MRVYAHVPNCVNASLHGLMRALACPINRGHSSTATHLGMMGTGVPTSAAGTASGSCSGSVRTAAASSAGSTSADLAEAANAAATPATPAPAARAAEAVLLAG